MTTQTITATGIDFPPFGRVRDLERVLGISRTTAYQLVSSGAIRCIRVGGQTQGAIRIPREAVEEFIAAGGVCSDNER